MSTQFYMRVPLCRRNGVGNHQVGFTWQQKLPKYWEIMSLLGADIVDEYGRSYTREQFADEIIKGVRQDEEEYGHR